MTTQSDNLRLEMTLTNGHGVRVSWCSNNIKSGTSLDVIKKDTSHLLALGLAAADETQKPLSKATKQQLAPAPKKTPRKKQPPQAVPAKAVKETKPKAPRRQLTAFERAQEAAEKAARKAARLAKRQARLAEKEAALLRPNSKKFLFTPHEMETLDFEIVIKRMIMYFNDGVDRDKIMSYLLAVDQVYHWDWLDVKPREVAGIEAGDLVMVILEKAQVWNWLHFKLFETFQHLLQRAFRRSYQQDYQRQKKKAAKAQLAGQLEAPYDEDLNLTAETTEATAEITIDPKKLSKKDRHLLEKYGGLQKPKVKKSRLQYWHKIGKKKQNKQPNQDS